MLPDSWDVCQVDVKGMSLGDPDDVACLPAIPQQLHGRQVPAMVCRLQKGPDALLPK